MVLVKAVEFIREKRAEFGGLLKKRDKIWTECEQFDVAQPEFPLFDEMQLDLEQYETNYLFYEEFTTDLQKLADQVLILSNKIARVFKLKQIKILIAIKQMSRSGFCSEVVPISLTSF